MDVVRFWDVLMRFGREVMEQCFKGRCMEMKFLLERNGGKKGKGRKVEYVE
jgi:hypothetical protein